MAAVVDRKFALLLNTKAAGLQLHNQPVLVKFLIEAGSQVIVDSHRRTDDLFGEVGVFHNIYCKVSSFYNKGFIFYGAAKNSPYPWLSVESVVKTPSSESLVVTVNLPQFARFANRPLLCFFIRG